MELMDEAEDTEATLAVYTQLGSVQQELERAKGRVQYLERSAAMSSITIDLIPEPTDSAYTIASWDPKATLDQAVKALGSVCRLAADVLIWIVVFVLPLAAIALSITWLNRRVSRRG
jgi:hypothetical protein